MRIDNATFRSFNEQAVKEPRRVIEIEFDPSNILTLSSSSEQTWATGTLYAGYLSGVTSTSARVDPETARTTIGTLSFSALDIDKSLTTFLRNQELAGRGARHAKVRYYFGYAGLDNADFVLRSTQIIERIAYADGEFDFSCYDVTREQRQQIFEKKKTTISQTVGIADTTINVADTADFELVAHGGSFSDSPDQTVGYLKIGDEVIRYTGKTATTFTGCTRGVLGTIAERYEVGNESLDRRESVEEFIYIELPIPMMVYALLTGVLYGTVNTLPEHWHLGIAEADIRFSDFQLLDLWDESDDTAGFIARFTDLSATDGKRFIETELLRLASLYSPVYADGTIGLKRRANIGQDAPYSAILDESVVSSVGGLSHDMTKIANVYRIEWNWNGDDFTRSNTLVDSQSIAVYGQAPTKVLKFKGLHGTRHTNSIVNSQIDALRDSFAGPPQSCTVELLHYTNSIEIGDVVRLRLARLQDYQGTATNIDRSFEVHQVSIDDNTGRVKLRLFGSTRKVTATPQDNATVGGDLPDAWYTSEGTNLGTALTVTDGGGGLGIISGAQSLAGGADMNGAASIFFWDGDLQIADGATLTITGNVQLRVRGFLDERGTITGVSGGYDGTVDPIIKGVIGENRAGVSGFIGATQGHGGVTIQNSLTYWPVQAVLTSGKYAVFPKLEIQYDQTNARLLGIPADLRGTSGGIGGRIGSYATPTSYLRGGSGGKSGAGLAIVCRGMDFAGSGGVDLSGGPSTVGETGTAGFTFAEDGIGGCGAPGGPGALLVLLDGSDAIYPTLASRLSAFAGNAPEPNIKQQVIGQSEIITVNEAGSGFSGPFDGIQNVDLWAEAHRVQYIPPIETPEEDVPSGVSALYYIRPTNGTAIKNGTGTLTIEARRLTDSSDVLLASGTVQLYDEADQLLGDGYTATLDSAAISGSIIVTLKDGVSGEALDTITLIDVADGTTSEATTGSIEASNGLSWVYNANAASWTPVGLITDLTATFYRGGVEVATRTVRVTNDGTGILTASDQGGTGEATSFTNPGSGTGAVTVAFMHTTSALVVAETVAAVLGGVDGIPGSHGTSVYTATIYQRAETQPAKPLNDEGSFDFDSLTLTPPAGWSAEPPDVDGNPLWACTGTFSVLANVGGVDSTVIWTLASKVVEDGLTYEITPIEIAQGLTNDDIDKLYPPGHVNRFGADPTGVADSTAAFNLATRSDYQSTGNNDTNFEREVIVGPGRYVISDSVFIHKGQHLRGAGQGASLIELTSTTSLTKNIFRLGAYDDGATGGFDLGGLPPEISGLWLEGGPTLKAVMFTGASGASMHNLFFTSPGYAIEVIGTDTRIFDVQVDQGGMGFRIGGHNHNFNNVLIYSLNFGIEFIADASDITFTDFQIYYSKFNGIRFTSGVTVDNILFNNTQFSLNEQNANFTGFIRVEGQNAKNITFNSPTFRNMKDGAIICTSGSSGNEFTFNNALFDGDKSVAAYVQSTTAYAAFIVNNTFVFNNPRFKNLLNEPLWLNGGTAITDVEVNGGIVENCAGSAIVDIATTDPLAGSRVIVNGVRTKDQAKQPFTIVDGGWHLGSDMGMTLVGNGGVTIAQYPVGPDSLYYVDTSINAATIRLPRSDAPANVRPRNGDKLTFIDYGLEWGTNNVTLLRGDNTINGAAGDYLADTAGEKVTLTYNEATGDWGVHGESGFNAATLTAYKRSATAPVDDPGTLAYTFATAAWTPGNGWSKSIPADDGNPIWAVSASAVSRGTTDEVLSADWSDPVKLAEDGAAGADGLNVATVYIYQRTITDAAPAKPSVASTYTFSDGLIAGLNNGWSGTIPAFTGANHYLWFTIATASNSGATDSIASSEWQPVQKLAENGTDGADGADGANGTQVEFVFQRSETKPATPTGNGIPTGWTDDPTAGTGALWMSKAEQEQDGTLIGAWSEPINLDARPVGNALNIGRRTNLLDQWYLNSTSTSLLSGDGNFSIVTGTFPIWGAAIQAVGSTDDDFFSEVIPIDRTRKHRVSCWVRQPIGDRTMYLLVRFVDSAGNTIGGDGDASPQWTSAGTFAYWGRVNSAASTDWVLYSDEFGGGDPDKGIPSNAVAISIGALVTRSTGGGTVETTQQFHDYHVVEVAEDGADGTDGTNGSDGGDGSSIYLATVYRRAASPPSAPGSTSASYNFGTKALTGPTGWSETIPSGSNPLYVTKATFSVVGTTGTDGTATWSTPTQVDPGTPALAVETSSSLLDTVAPATPLISDSHISNGNRITVTFYGRAGWGGSSGAAEPTQVTLRLRRRIDAGAWTTIAEWTMPAAADPDPAQNAYNRLSEVLPEDAAGTSAPDYPANGLSYYRRTSISSKILWWAISGSLFDTVPAAGDDVEYELVHSAVGADNGNTWSVEYSLDTAEAGG